ncbi:hypothetical protein CTAYLR_009417 [Chrysophaeum taylorii]|uniref:J domain-containing protein n=1 Tax=Chrysophaeum taylorii TaxID=2483200 RepID=A0AAD7UJ72_9STRA|nr:hypothetical protein CTAYLR_009417 [Chrysophaeum taylorii]
MRRGLRRFLSSKTTAASSSSSSSSSSLFEGLTEFEVLGVEAGVTLDSRELETKFRDLQRQLHPDKYAQKSAAERLEAEKASARVNDAYATLRDPLQRADRAVALKLGRERVLGEAAPEASVLAHALEIREAVEECEDEYQLGEIFDDNQRRIDEALDLIARSYDRQAFEEAAAYVVRLRYLATIRADILQVSERRRWSLHHPG